MGGVVARLEEGWETIGDEWEGLRHMMRNPQRLNKKLNWKKFKA